MTGALWEDNAAGRAAFRPAVKRRHRLSRTANARATIAGFGHGVDITFGLTYGQFSQLDLLEAVVELTGPADVAICTWTVGRWDAERVAKLLEAGRWRSVRFLTDSSDGSKRGQCTIGELARLFGREAVRSTRTHAKFAVITNAEWNVLVQSSMNLNQNMRSEQFSLVDDADSAAFALSIVDELFRELPPGGSGDRTMPGLSRLEAVEPDLGLEVCRQIEMGDQIV